jgi:stage V sporulation protein R
MDRFGIEEVETFIDACLSIEDLIDIHSPFVKRFDETSRYAFDKSHDEVDEPLPPGRFHSKDYMEPFINPPHFLAAEAERLREKTRQQRFPSSRRDVTVFAGTRAAQAPQLDAVDLQVTRPPLRPASPDQDHGVGPATGTDHHDPPGTHCGRHRLLRDHHSGTLASSPNKLNPYKLPRYRGA